MSKGPSTASLILLRPGHRSLETTVRQLIEWEPNENADDEKKDQHRRHCNVPLCDFDNVSYQVKIVKGEYDVMTVSMNLPFLDDVMDHGAGDCLASTYEGMVADEVEQGYNVTIKVNFNDFQTPEAKNSLVNKLEMLKSNVVGSVFDKYMAGLEGKMDPFMFDMRPDTQVYFAPGNGRCSVIFGITFAEPVDMVLAKVFLQEFKDAKRSGGKDLGAAPPVSFDVKPSRDLAPFGITEPTGNLGFISFTVLPTHVSSPAKRARVVATLQGFRTYLQYHLKCSKSFFHSRMRKKCADMLLVLNRAKVKETVVHSTEQKTKITGRGKGL
jgi:actin related protein 2/3 complex subunit 2